MSGLPPNRDCTPLNRSVKSCRFTAPLFTIFELKKKTKLASIYGPVSNATIRVRNPAGYRCMSCTCAYLRRKQQRCRVTAKKKCLRFRESPPNTEYELLTGNFRENGTFKVRPCQDRSAHLTGYRSRLTVLKLQSRFGDRPLLFQVVCSKTGLRS